MRKNRLNTEVAPNQSRITQFFVKTGETGTTDSPSSSHPGQVPLLTPFSSRTNIRRKAAAAAPSIDYTDVDGEVEILTPPPPTPKELIDLLSSDDDSNQEKQVQEKKDKENPTVRVPPLKTNCNVQQEAVGNSVNNIETKRPENIHRMSSDSSGDELLSQIDVEEVVRLSQSSVEEDINNIETKRPENIRRMSSDSSGDEILSQIDIEEVVRLSQSSVEDITDGGLGQSQNKSFEISASLVETVDRCVKSMVTSPKKQAENISGTESAARIKGLTSQKLPKKSPKSKMNKFSPVRHLRMKRTSSQASLGSPSSSSCPSPSKDASGSRKRLQFGSTSPSGKGGSGIRYYLKNFRTILSEVVDDPFNSYLLSDEDHKIIQTFTSLSIDCQCLYVRLFQRKWDWKPMNRINNRYKELPANLSECCKDLVLGGFFEEISASNTSLEEILDTLDLVKMGNLAKKMMVGTAKKTKEAYRDALLRKVKSQKTLSGASSADAMKKGALAELGTAVRVSTQSKALFSRLFILYSPPQYWDVEQDQAATQLLIVMLNNRGQVEYPDYIINKSTIIYKDREDLIKFYESFSMHSNLVAFTESKDWQSVAEVATTASSLFQNLVTCEETINHDSNLPRYLRIYTAGSVLCHTCWMGVDAFQKLKDFSKANELINTILGQSLYLPNYRGRCWERLAINTGHLKRSKEEIETLLEKALQDQCLQDNHKLLLSQRLEKIRENIQATISKRKQTPSKRKPSPKAKNKIIKGKRGHNKNKKYVDTTSEDSETENEESPVIANGDAVTQLVQYEKCTLQLVTLKHEIPTKTIVGEKMDKGPGSMGKSVFISHQDSTGSNRMSSVEQHAIDYYLDNEGFSAGIHGEGSIVVTLYGILFWDIIFCDLPDAFHNKYQGFPLDLHFDDFYIRRKEMIEEKLYFIRNILSVGDLCGIVDEIWEKNVDKMSIVSWSLFGNNMDGLKSLMKAMGTKVIAKICERLSRNYRYYSSGFPDVVMWNDKGDGKLLFVEVKGPGDSLSPKQQLWLDFLVDNEIPAEVCHVKAVSNKRIRLGP